MKPGTFRYKKPLLALAVTAAISASPVSADKDDDGSDKDDKQRFNRIATFPVYLNTDINDETVAEIVAVSTDGNTLIYTDGKTENLGFVDITDAANPLAAGTVALGGEPTSVAVKDGYALVAVNTSSDFVNTSGNLQVIAIVSGDVVATLDLGGQPDSVAVSPDGRYAAIAIENERDEDLGYGIPPQAPEGFLVIVDLVGEPASWSTREVSMIGLDGMLYANDPEPEYVDINKNNMAVVTLQENNHIALINLKTGEIKNHFSAGTVNLGQVDTEDDDLIQTSSELLDIPREPDGVNWISNSLFATADEGDLDGGSRGFTVFNTKGDVVYASGNSVELEIIRHGHYPDKRSDNKGNEPENTEFGRYGNENLLFVGSERANVVLVYKIKNNARHLTPQLTQILPTPVKPEGLLAIPQRNLFIAAGEEDSRDDKIRSSLSIYQLGDDQVSYPTVVSDDRDNGTPIPWGALSGLAIDPEDDEDAYTVHDSFYKNSRILKLDIEDSPAKITKEIILDDALDKLAAIDMALVNDDKTVNLDLEGITVRSDGGFWLVSEGAGTVGSDSRPFESLNLLIRADKNGLIEDVVMLPEAVNDRQVRFGFEGVASVGRADSEILYVAFQREWEGDADNHVRIGRYDTSLETWTFFYYPIEIPASANGGWVGLSDLTYLGDDEFAAIERDNQGGPDAAIKRLYSFSITGLTAAADDGSTPAFPVLSKILRRDMMGDLDATGGLVLEKVEGLAVTKDGTALVVNDNDGVDDSNGETQLLKLKGVF